MIIVQCELFASETQRGAIRADIMEQAKTGLIVLPNYIKLGAAFPEDGKVVVVAPNQGGD